MTVTADTTRAASRLHPERSIAGVVAVDTDEGKRVIAVRYEQHDPLTCDGTHLLIDTTGFLRCPVSGCAVEYDPEFRCPDHGVADS